MTNIFSYGSLMYETVFTKVAGANALSGPATLKDWSRHRITAKTYPAAVPASGARIVGVLWIDVPESAVERLDRFEGKEYLRETVTVIRPNGQAVSAEIYRWLDMTMLESEDWSADSFEKSHLDTFFEQHTS